MIVLLAFGETCSANRGRNRPIDVTACQKLLPSPGRLLIVFSWLTESGLLTVCFGTPVNRSQHPLGFA